MTSRIKITGLSLFLTDFNIALDEILRTFNDVQYTDTQITVSLVSDDVANEFSITGQFDYNGTPSADNFQGGTVVAARLIDFVRQAFKMDQLVIDAKAMVDAINARSYV